MEIEFEFDDEQVAFETSKVTITVERRNGKKCITNVMGLADDLDLKKIMSYLKKKHNCSGSIIKDDVHGDIMSLTGDQKENIYHFLIDQEICCKDDIILKGV